MSHIIQHSSVSFTLLRINTSDCENLPLPAGLRKTTGRQGEITQGSEFSTRNQEKKTQLCRERKKQIEQQVIHPKHFLIQTPNNVFLTLHHSFSNTVFLPAYSSYLFSLPVLNYRHKLQKVLFHLPSPALSHSTRAWFTLAFQEPSLPCSLPAHKPGRVSRACKAAQEVYTALAQTLQAFLTPAQHSSTPTSFLSDFSCDLCCLSVPTCYLDFGGKKKKFILTLIRTCLSSESLFSFSNLLSFSLLISLCWSN